LTLIDFVLGYALAEQPESGVAINGAVQHLTTLVHN